MCRISTWLTCAVPAALAAAGACAASPDDSPGELLVAAASDLAIAMPELAATFRERTGVVVNTTLGSSGQLAQQIQHGAPVDVFLSADRIWVDFLETGGRVRAEDRAIYAVGPLVLVTSPRRPEPFTRLEELGAAGALRVAIANPAHAPYGRAAREALRAAGVLDVLEPRLVIAENVRQTLQFVGTGNVDAAIAARALMDDRSPHWVPVPDSLHSPLVQEGAVVRGRDHAGTAAGFLRFLTGADGREILERYGFMVPEPAH